MPPSPAIGLDFQRDDLEASLFSTCMLGGLGLQLPGLNHVHPSSCLAGGDVFSC